MSRRGLLSDASTLIYLAKADALPDAGRIAGALLVSPAAWRESVGTGRRGHAEAVRIRSARKQGLIQILDLDARAERKAIELRSRHRIGLGESQVLAAARKSSTVLMDDRRAARVARVSGLIPLRTVSLPAFSCRRGLLGASEALALLRRLATVIPVRADVLMRLETDLLERQP